MSTHPIPDSHATLPLPPGCESRCPGCAHRGLSAQASEARKAHWLRVRLAPWADRLTPLRGIAGAGRWGYRDKLALTAAWEGRAWAFGLTHRDELIPIPRCPVHSPRARAVLGLLAAALPPAAVFPLAFYVQSGAQATLVLKTATEPPLDWLGRTLADGLGAAGLEGLWLNLFPAAGRNLFTKRGWRLVWGRATSVDADGLVYGPSAFRQLLPALYWATLDEAETFLDPTPGATLVDLYCGLGASPRRWIARGARVLGVETGGEAVDCAQRNAPGAEVLRGRCAQRLPQLQAWAGTGGLLYANPPRTGLEPEVLDWIARDYRPRRLAYLSCSAGTLARDLTALEQAGLTVARISPYDFFPQTHHVETLALLSRA